MFVTCPAVTALHEASLWGNDYSLISTTTVLLCGYFYVASLSDQILEWTVKIARSSLQLFQMEIAIVYVMQ